MTVVQDWAPLSTAGGVIVGVALGRVGTWWQSRLNWKQTGPRNSTPVAAELLATALRARNWIARTVFSLVNAEATQNHELVTQLQTERMEGFAELREPSVPTTWNLARSQILRPAGPQRAAQPGYPGRMSTAHPPVAAIVPLVRSASRVLTHRLRRRPAAALDPALPSGFAPLSGNEGGLGAKLVGRGRVCQALTTRRPRSRLPRRAGELAEVHAWGVGRRAPRRLSVEAV